MKNSTCALVATSKTTSIIIGVLAFGYCLSSSANAAPGFPQIIFDSRQGSGQNLYTTQGVTYNATGGFWAASAKAVSITFDGINFTPLIDGTVDLRGAFINSTVENEIVTGNFTTFGIPGQDLIVQDNTGLLLAGTYGKRQIQCDTVNSRFTSQATLTVTGGSLASFFTNNGMGMMMNNLFDIIPLCSANTFKNNFDGQLDGVISQKPTPESSTTISLLALGTLGAASTLKRKLKPSQSTEKETTKVS